jgi:HAE1 family hydrophobic/amphiphilic exporter-1
MNVWEWSVARPIGISMLAFIVMLLGGVAFYHLPIDLMPDITYPTISMTANYANAGPVEVETLLTRPIEQAISAVPGVEEITSTSSEGRCSVRVTFAWGTDLDAASNDIRDRLDRIMARFPEGVERPSLRKFDLANFPILIFGVSGQLDPVQLLKVIEDQVKYRIERIPGVAALDIMGGRRREIHVNLFPERLQALQIRPDQVIARLRQENLNLPAGIIEVGNYEYTIRTPGEFFQVEQLRDVIVKEDGKSLIRLGEVAEIDDHWERVRSIVRVNGQPGVRVSVNKQSGKNTVQVADAVLAEVERINQELPQIQVTKIVDSSKYIRRSIANVSSSAVVGGFLAILILLFFLRDVASTLVIGTSIPFSVIATFVLMYFNGFTLNIMSLGGVALGIGMLVDNSIVVLENIFRHCEAGMSPNEAAVKGCGEVAAPILASTTTTLVIFLPLLFVEGMTGLMFKQLSYVVGFSLLCSLGISLTVVPMLCSKLLQGRARGKSPAAATGAKEESDPHSQDFLTRIYVAVLGVILNWRLSAILLAMALLGACVMQARGIATEFMPTADEGEVRVSAEMEVGSRLSLVEEKIVALEKTIIRAVPELTSLVTSVGGGGMGGGGRSNRGDFRIPLVEKTDRKRSSARIAGELRNVLNAVPGMKLRIREGQGLFIFRMGAQDADKLQIQIRGHNLEKADAIAKQIESQLSLIPGISDVRLSRESGAPERLISIDRRRAADQKLSVTRIAEFLEIILSGKQAGNFRESGDEFKILVQSENSERMSLEEIMDLTLLNTANQPVALRNVAEIISREGPLLIERADQERIVEVSADPGERPLGDVLAEAQEKIRNIPLPQDFSIVISGDFEEQQRSFRELMFSFVLALILVYMVMAIQYESLRDPLIVMTTVPFAAIGVILALILTKSTFNVQSFIGCIMLGGIIVNNSILLVDHANYLFREEGMRLRAALLQAGGDRLRPILMTASTTILGLLPMAIGLGEGGEVQAPMARVVIGGLLCSTLVSLLIIPAVYSLFYQFSDRKGLPGSATEVTV